MKQKIYILGLVTSAIIVLGTMFKINHWPLADTIITTGILALVFVFLPLALINHYRNESNRQFSLLYFVTWLTFAVVFTGMLFKIEHWPGASYLLLLALPFPYVIFLPVFLAVTSKIKNFNIYNSVFVLLLLVIISVFSLLLALDVSKDRIYDSLDLGHKYVKLGKVLDRTAVKNDQSVLVKDIYNIIQTIDEYKSRILREDGTTVVQWDADTRALRYPTSVDVVLRAMYPGQIDTRLENSLRKLIEDLNVTPGYKELAAAAPDILDFFETSAIPGGWTDRILRNTQSWVLVYLEGLKTNLKLISASL